MAKAHALVIRKILFMRGSVAVEPLFVLEGEGATPEAAQQEVARKAEYECRKLSAEWEHIQDLHLGATTSEGAVQPIGQNVSFVMKALSVKGVGFQAVPIKVMEDLPQIVVPGGLLE